MTAISFNDLTLDEIETIELLADRGIDEIMQAGKPKGRALKAILYIVNKRTNPDFTIEQAGKLTLQDATGLFEDDTDPKE